MFTWNRDPISNFQLHISWGILAGILRGSYGVLPDRLPGVLKGKRFPPSLARAWSWLHLFQKISDQDVTGAIH
jgi:hypothetical protein